MLTHINTLDELEKEAIVIDQFLTITISEEIEEALQRGNDLSVYMARTGKMLADAKYYKDIALSYYFDVYRNHVSAPSVLNKLVDAACQRENFLVNWIERLHRVSVHQIDWLRTVVSNAKEERRVSSGVSGSYNR